MGVRGGWVQTRGTPGNRDAEDLGIFTFHKKGREEAQVKVSDLRAGGIKVDTEREEGVQATMEEREFTMALVDGSKGTAISDKIGKLDVKSVEDDHNEIIEEESFNQNALNRIDQRHTAEMGILQRRTEELERHYMNVKEKQQQLLQQQLQQQLSSLMFSPPPGHTSRNSQGGVPTTSSQQVPQPAPARYAYMPTGTQPQFETINGQQLQVVCDLQGQQILAVQGGPGHPQQYFSLPPEQTQQLSIPRLQSFVPARFFPRPVEQEGRERDSVAGGGEEVHRISEQPAVSNFGVQTPQPQNPGFQPQAMHPLTQTQIPSNYVPQNPPQNLGGCMVNIPPGVAQTVVQRQVGGSQEAER